MHIERVGSPQFTGNGSEINISALSITASLEDEDLLVELDAAIRHLIELRRRLEASGILEDGSVVRLADINNRIINKTVYIIDHRSFEKPIHYIAGDSHYYLYKNSIYRSDGAYSPRDIEYQIRSNEGRLPRCLGQAVLCLMEELSFESKVALMSCERDDAVFSNLSLVVKIKNNFGLCGSNKELYASCESETVDEASRKIIEALWDRLQETML